MMMHLLPFLYLFTLKCLLFSLCLYLVSHNTRLALVAAEQTQAAGRGPVDSSRSVSRPRRQAGRQTHTQK